MFSMFLFVLLFSYQVSNLSSRYQQIGFVVFEPFPLSMRSYLFFIYFFMSFLLQTNMHLHLLLSGNLKVDHPRNY